MFWVLTRDIHEVVAIPSPIEKKLRYSKILSSVFLLQCANTCAGANGKLIIICKHQVKHYCIAQYHTQKLNIRWSNRHQFQKSDISFSSSEKLQSFARPVPSRRYNNIYNKFSNYLFSLFTYIYIFWNCNWTKYNTHIYGLWYTSWSYNGL